MNSPKVTVLLPVFNGERYLAEAIESVLNQTFQEFELLVFNDGSTDRTSEVVKSYKNSRIRLINNHSNLGLIKTLNRGLKLAKGKYIARMDADDIMLPKRLELQSRYLDTNGHICVIGSWWDNISATGKLLGTTRVPAFDYECAFMLFEKGENPVGHPCVMYRTNIIRKIGYSPKAEDAEDLDLWFKLIAQGHRLANIPKVLTLYRHHQKQASNHSEKQKEKHEEILSSFVTEQLGKFNHPHQANLLRPIHTINHPPSDIEQLNKILALKKAMLCVFFDKYQLSLSNAARCTAILWESLLPAAKIEGLSKIRGLRINTRFCAGILKTRVLHQGCVNYLFYISFIANVCAIITKKIGYKAFSRFFSGYYKTS